MHDHTVWADLIGPVRNQVMSDMGWKEKVAIPEAGALTSSQQKKGYVPFGDVLLKFAAYLNSTEGPHRWPMRPDSPNLFHRE